ncbi:MAG: hypothetical protein M1826_002333 [Phylliscum demangeonii]|nr:MAG: hypothetical protein M1826_002333 [Phylliscum demangeonii]
MSAFLAYPLWVAAFAPPGPFIILRASTSWTRRPTLDSTAVTSSTEHAVSGAESDTETGEAVYFIPVLHAAEVPQQLLRYAAPVTKRMPHFSTLTHYSAPPLPRNWTPPAWLTTQDYLGLTNIDPADSSSSASATTSVTHGLTFNATQHLADGGGTATTSRPVWTFIPPPLSFLQEWVALRRQAQDIVHTPLGHVLGMAAAPSLPVFAMTTAIAHAGGYGRPAGIERCAARSRAANGEALVGYSEHASGESDGSVDMGVDPDEDDNAEVEAFPSESSCHVRFGNPAG